MDVLAKMIAPEELEALCGEHAPVPRRAPKLSASQLVSGLVYHQLQPGGALEWHAEQLHGVKMSNSAHAQRRRGLPRELFEDIMRVALRPLADPARHPEGFFGRWRLVGIDGTEWSVTNTPAIRRALPKAASRRLSSAFAKLRLVTLVELGMHQPLAAAAGPASEGELTLAARLWSQVPDGSLLIADRLFGTPRTLYYALEAWQERDIACLVRIKNNLKAKVLEKLCDGSAIVEVQAPAAAGQPAQRLQLREIRAEGVRQDGKVFKLRFWTTLLDPVAYPARELAAQYARRWEQEIYYRELKLDVRSSSLLTSHTVETAMQEIAALVLASAVVAHLRLAAANQLHVAPARISFMKMLMLTQQLWQSFAWGRSSRTPAQSRDICGDFFRSVQSFAVLPERRKRSCPRAIRQPVSSWPRKIDQPSFSGPVSLSIIPLS